MSSQLFMREDPGSSNVIENRCNAKDHIALSKDEFMQGYKAACMYVTPAVSVRVHD
jgi:hypothetical protein